VFKLALKKREALLRQSVPRIREATPRTVPGGKAPAGPSPSTRPLRKTLPPVPASWQADDFVEEDEPEGSVNERTSPEQAKVWLDENFKTLDELEEEAELARAAGSTARRRSS